MTTEIAVEVFQPNSIIMNPGRMGELMQFADMMSKAVVALPDHFRGKPADCLAITLQAMRWNMDPYVVASKTAVINGKLSYEAQLVVAVVQNSGAIRGNFKYEFEGTGQNIACRVGAVQAGETEITWGEWLSMTSITTRNSPLWKTNPKQQMGYLQARNWARLYTPGAILGVYTPEELEMVERTDEGNDAAPPPPVSSMKPSARAPAAPTPPPPAPAGPVEDARVVQRDVIDGDPAPAADAGTPPPPPAQAPTPATTSPAPRPTAAPVTQSADDSGELATDGMKVRLETQAKARDKNLSLIYAKLGINAATLTKAQFKNVLDNHIFAE